MAPKRSPGRRALLLCSGFAAGFGTALIGVATGTIYHRDDVLIGCFPRKTPKSATTDQRNAGTIGAYLAESAVLAEVDVTVKE
jgi:hypothetical protein